MAANASTLPAGLRWLRPSVMPSSVATVRTAGSLSPLRMADGSPMAARWSTAGRASGRSGVVTAMAPTGWPSRSTTTTVSPRWYRSDTARSMEAGRPDGTNRPTSTRWPSTVPTTPTPGKDRISEARSPEWAAAVMATAMGCSLSDSTAAAMDSTSSSDTPTTAVTKVTSAWRSVNVPVLSNTTWSTWARRSSTSPLRMKIPMAAARPQPTIMATGAARPMAQGQATNKTASPLSTAVPGCRSPATR